MVTSGGSIRKLSFINKGQTGPTRLMLSPTFPDRERKLA